MRWNTLRRIQLLDIACVFLIGFVVSIGLAVETQAESGEEIPNADAQLTSNELRWCEEVIDALYEIGCPVGNPYWEYDAIDIFNGTDDDEDAEHVAEYARTPIAQLFAGVRQTKLGACAVENSAAFC